MTMAWACPPQFVDRLASNALASSSSGRRQDRCPPPRARCLGVTVPRLAISSGDRQARARMLCAAPAVERNGAPLDFSRCLLQPADYSFYQRMPPSDVTEQFLWDSRLAPLLGYLPEEEVQQVREALSLAYDAHSGQMRKSGEPFITHPVEVTRILAELEMDHESLVAGLLHDTVEDCGELVELEEIGFHFGPAVRRIVEGETKFSKLPTHHPEREAAAAAAADSPATAAVAQDPKAQDLQFLFLAMTEEVRIIVVKLADRLHNMRTMKSMPPGKQRRIAQETLTVFAPLARLLGLYTIKEELEELGFKYAMPQQYAVMRKAVNRLWEQQHGVVDAAAEVLRARLQEDPFMAGRLRGVRVTACKKALYGTWRKLQDSGKSVRDVSEIAQLRVVLEPATTPAGGASSSNGSNNGSSSSSSSNGSSSSGEYANGNGNAFANGNGSANGAVAASSNGAVPYLNGSSNGSKGKVALNSWASSDKQLCYHVMGLVHAMWAPVPGSMKDYIATPKPNNYQSLHTSVIPTGLTTAAAAYEEIALPAPNGAGGSWAGGGVRARRPGPGLFPIEVQIRTEEMERLAMYGIAVESWSCADYPQGPLQERQLRGGAPAAGQDGLPFPYSVVPGLVGPSLEGSSSSSDEGGSYSNGAGSLPSSTNGAHGPGSSGQCNGAAPVGTRLDSQTMSRRINWLNSIRQWQEEFVGTLTASEFVACITDDLLGQGVFVFTPSGQVMRLPKGSTAVDFAYHIHTDVGNTMVAARVNGKVVGVDHELHNAEVVEVITYKGPVNAAHIKRHQRWLEAARTKTARHKIAKFLREHAALAAAQGLGPPGDSPLSAPGDLVGGPQAVWLLLQCDDRHGLLADIANAISRHGHNICSYSGSVDREAGVFVMEYELEGEPGRLGALCEELSGVECVQGWSTGCPLPAAGVAGGQGGWEGRPPR